MLEEYDSETKSDMKDVTIEKHHPKKNVFRGLFRNKLCLIFFVFIQFIFVFTVYLGFYGENDHNMLYFTDIHYDKAYNPLKTRKTWCHDIDNSSSSTPAIYGKYGCESPANLVQAFFNDVKRVIPNPRAILFGGDATNTWSQTHTFEGVLNTVKNITDTLNTLYPKIPLVYNLGNGDYYPSYGKWETDKEQFAKLADIFGHYLTEKQRETFKKGGYYYYDDSHHKIRIISFNSIIYTVNRPLIPEEDPYDQFNFLELVLDTNYHTILLFHMHPGMTDPDKPLEWHKKFADKFTDILNRYKPETILTAHTHFDMLMPVYGTDLIAMSNPGISPRLDNNPSFRVYHFTKGHLLDYAQYTFNLALRDVIPKWKFDYRFSQTYKQKYISQEALKETIKWINRSPQNFWVYFSHVHTYGAHNMYFFNCVMNTKNFDEYQNCKNNFM